MVLAEQLRAAGVRRGDLVGLALDQMTGAGVAAAGAAPIGLGAEVADVAAALTHADADVGPRWVTWSAATASAALGLGWEIPRSWDLAAVHRLLVGGSARRAAADLGNRARPAGAGIGPAGGAAGPVLDRRRRRRRRRRRPGARRRAAAQRLARRVVAARPGVAGGLGRIRARGGRAPGGDDRGAPRPSAGEHGRAVGVGRRAAVRRARRTTACRSTCRGGAAHRRVRRGPAARPRRTPAPPRRARRVGARATLPAGRPPTCATRRRSASCCCGRASTCRTPGRGGSSRSAARHPLVDGAAGPGARPSGSPRPTATPGSTPTSAPTAGCAASGPAATARPGG